MLPYASIDSPLPASLSLVGATITWQVPPIPVGGSVEVSFSVTARADAGGATVVNLAAPTSGGGHCSPCRAEHSIRTRSVSTADPPARPGVSTSGIDTGTSLRWAFGPPAGGLLLLTVAGARRRLGAERST